MIIKKNLQNINIKPQKPYFTKKLPSPDGWIVPGTKMTNSGPFSLNKSSKIQIFSDILYPFCQRLLRPADVTFLKTKTVYQKIYNLRIPKLLSNKILLAYFYLSEPIHNVQFNVRYPVSFQKLLVQNSYSHFLVKTQVHKNRNAAPEKISTNCAL